MRRQQKNIKGGKKIKGTSATNREMACCDQ